MIFKKDCKQRQQPEKSLFLLYDQSMPAIHANPHPPLLFIHLYVICILHMQYYSSSIRHNPNGKNKAFISLILLLQGIWTLNIIFMLHGVCSITAPRSVLKTAQIFHL